MWAALNGVELIVMCVGCHHVIRGGALSCSHAFTAATRASRFFGKPTAVRERANRPAALRYAAGTGSCSLSVAWPPAFQPSRPSLNVRTFV